MTFPQKIKFVMFLLPIFFVFTHLAQAQVIENTFACDYPWCTKKGRRGPSVWRLRRWAPITEME